MKPYATPAKLESIDGENVHLDVAGVAAGSTLLC